MHIKKNLYFLLLLFIFITLNANEKKFEDISVQLKWFNQYQFAGIFIAKEKGFYEEEGLNVTIKERDLNKNNIVQVINGDSEYGIADAVILRYRAEGYKVKVLATIFQHNAMVLLSKKGSGIVSPYEMKGKSLSFQEGLDDSIITKLLDFADLTKYDYIKRPMDFTHMDFVSGETDVTEAYISIEPYWLKKKYNIDVNIIDPKNYGIDFYGDLLFTTQDEIDNHPARVEAFTKATLKGWAYALEHIDETIQIILDKYNTRDLTYEQLLYEARITKDLIATKYIALGSVKKERFEVLSRLYKNKNIDEKYLDKAVEEIIYDPYTKTDILAKYKYHILISLTILLSLVLVLVLYYHNKRLRYLVREKTKELEKATIDAKKAAHSKSIFLANMSHEIRTPMNAIIGFIEQLQKNEQDKSKQKTFQIIKHSGETLVAIINDILDITKLENEKMLLDIKSVNIRDILNKVKLLLEQQAIEKNIGFYMHISDDIPHCIKVDDIRLEQIIINILSNAIKFTSENGKVDLFASFDLKKNILQITIKDTGIGIASQNIEKIFHMFEQEDNSTTRKFGGTGLGLAISKKLVNLMDGELNINSTLGEGSEFSVSLPCTICNKEEVARCRIVEEVDDDIIQIENKILIVEDNKTNQLLLSMILDEYSLEYDIANNGQEAVTMFQNNKYSIILMDENMPIMDGITATKNILNIESQKKLKHTPIIAVTANALNDDRRRFLEAGMDDYVAKPYQENDIVNILKKFSS